MAGTGSTAAPTGSLKDTSKSQVELADALQKVAPRSATMTLLEMIDWEKLPADAKAIVRRIGPMLCEGYSVKEIARSLGRKDDWVSARIRILRDAIAAQVSEQLDGMEAELRAHIEKLVKAA